MSRGLYLKATLDDQVTPRLKDIEREARKTGDESEKSGEKGKRGFGKMGQALSQLPGPLGAVAGGLGLVAVGIGTVVAATVGFKKFMDKGLQMNATLEKIETQFKVVTGSAAAASKKMAEVVEFSATTPFQLAEVAEAAKQLEAFGIKGTENLRRVGDAAAAADRPITEMSMVFGRIKSGAFGEAFMRLAETGIATREMLEMKGLKFDKSGAYQGSAEQAMAAVNSIVDERFGGMMEKMSQTWEGASSTLKDNWSLLAADLTSGAFEQLKGGIFAMTEAIQNFAKSDTAAKLKQGIADGAYYSMVAVARLVHVIRNIGPYTKATLIYAMGYWNALFGGITDGVKYFAQNWRDGLQWLQLIYQAYIETVVGYYVNLWNALRDIGSLILNYYKGIGSVIKAALTGNLGDIPDLVKDAWEQLKDDGKAIVAEFSDTLSPKWAEAGEGFGASMGNAFKTRWTAELDSAKAAADKALAEVGEYKDPERVGSGGGEATDEVDDGGENSRGVEKASETASQKVAEHWESAADKMESVWDSSWNNLTSKVMDGSAQLKDLTNGLWDGMRKAAFKAIGDVALNYLAKLAKMALGDKLFQAQKTAAQASGTAARTALQATETAATTAQTAADTSGAASKTMNAHAGIPFVGIAIAVGLIATMMAVLSGIKSHRTGRRVMGAGSGSEDDQLAFLSAGEDVVPANERRRDEEIRSQLQAGFGEAAGGDLTINFGGSDREGSIRDYLEREVVPELKRLNRQGRLRLT